MSINIKNGDPLALTLGYAERVRQILPDIYGPQGLGTSMLQMGNICRWPLIWVPPTLAAAIIGPISTMVFKLHCNGVAAGMGTCGLVGPIGVISSTEHSPMMWVGLVLCCLVLPAVLSLLFSEIMRKLGWIKFGDMKLGE